MTRAATVKRGGKRPVVKARSRKSAQKTVSAWSKARKAMPFKQDSIDRFVTWSMAGMVGIAVVAGAMMAGLPGYVGTAVAGSIGRAGFAVKRVEVTGIDRMERLIHTGIGRHRRAFVEGAAPQVAHEPLDRLDCPLGGESPLVAGGPADEQSAVGREPDDRRQDRVAACSGGAFMPFARRHATGSIRQHRG